MHNRMSLFLDESKPRAAISQKAVNKIKAKSRELVKMNINSLSERDRSLWRLIQRVNELANSIRSCDLPSDNIKHNSVFVYLVQQRADKILNAADKSWLEKIIDIAVDSGISAAGNCMEKAFFAFAALQYNIVQSPAFSQHPVKLELAFYRNHFIVIVDDHFLVDAWLNIAFPFDSSQKESVLKSVFKNFGTLETYFTIQPEHGYLSCYKHKVTEDSLCLYDNESIHYLYNFTESGWYRKCAGSKLFDFSAPIITAQPDVKSKRAAIQEIGTLVDDINADHHSALSQHDFALFASPAKKSKHQEVLGLESAKHEFDGCLPKTL